MAVSVVAVASQKGGVGKTTTVVHLGHGLALQGQEVLLVDLDPQGQVGISLGAQPEPGVFNTFVGELEIDQVLRRTGRDRLWLVPGDKRTATAQTVLLAEQRDVLSAVKAAFVKPFRSRPDVVVFDTAPSVGGFQEAALFAADVVLIPVATDHLAIFGVTGVLETLKALRRRGWSGQVCALPTFYDERTRHSKRTLRMLQKRLAGLGVDVLDPVHTATDLREASAAGKTIFEYRPNARSAQEYAKLVWSLKGRL
jgi:chromosome partitioning protein